MGLGLHYSDVLLGRVFSQSSTPLGLALPLYTATAATGGSLPIWNPPGSGVNVELIQHSIARGSGTATFGAIGLMVGQLNSIGTATGCSAFGAIQPVNRLTGLQSGSSKTMSSNAGTVTVTAGTATAAVGGVPGAGWMQTMFSHNLEADTGTAHAATPCVYEWNGTFVLTPGYICYVAATTATTAIYASSVIWKEVPIS